MCEAKDFEHRTGGSSVLVTNCLEFLRGRCKRMDVLPDRLASYVAGPAIGLCVVALYALINERMGVTTSYQMIAQVVARRPVREMWRVWFFVGLVGGAFLAVILGDGPRLTSDYGALGALVPIAVLIPVLFLGGVLSGFGARWGGGCTCGTWHLRNLVALGRELRRHNDVCGHRDRRNLRCAPGERR